MVHNHIILGKKLSLSFLGKVHYSCFGSVTSGTLRSRVGRLKTLKECTIQFSNHLSQIILWIS